ANIRKGLAMLKHTTLALALGMIGLPAAAADGWTPLLEQGLRGWQGSGGGDVFRASAGTLTIDGAGQGVYVGGGKGLDLRDFELHAEVLTRPGGRARLALHPPAANPRSAGGVGGRPGNSSSVTAPGQVLQKTGSLVWLRPVVRALVPDGRWFPVQVTVRGRRVQVRVDGQLVMDYVEPEKAESGPRLKSGTVGIRGHGGSG